MRTKNYLNRFYNTKTYSNLLCIKNFWHIYCYMPFFVLNTGKDRRIRRYSTSRGFWNEPSKMRSESKNTRKNKQLTYSDRISKCGDSIHLFGIEDCIDKKTGEINPKPVWIGTLTISRLWCKSPAFNMRSNKTGNISRCDLFKICNFYRTHLETPVLSFFRRFFHSSDTPFAAVYL